MQLPHPLYRGRWVRRYKRFLIDVVLDNGAAVTAHCPNSGSMKGCGGPGGRVAVSHHPEPHRKLAYTLQLTRSGPCWVGVNTMFTNRIAEETVRAGFFPELAGYDYIRREVTVGKSRLDFELRKSNSRAKPLFMEVKNVSLVEDEIAMFPDAVTTRGARHVRELDDVVRSGARAAVLFIVQRNDAAQFAPAVHIDPDFAKALSAAARNGVRVLACACSVSPQRITVVRRLPVAGL